MFLFFSDVVLCIQKVKTSLSLLKLATLEATNDFFKDQYLQTAIDQPHNSVDILNTSIKMSIKFR